MSEFIFTKHALQRLQERSISIDQAESVLRHPTQTFPGKKDGTIKFVRDVNGRNTQLVATYLPDQKKWLVVSAWVRGEEDKVPFMWVLITAPFKLIWWSAKQLWKLGRKRNTKIA
jgi:hypothetical protein